MEEKGSCGFARIHGAILAEIPEQAGDVSVQPLVASLPAMRSEREVRAMLALFEEINEALWLQVSAAVQDGADCDTGIAQYNRNGQLIAAFKWVLGEDTIKISKRSDCAAISNSKILQEGL